jgi:extracellular matrix protein 14
MLYSTVRAVALLLSFSTVFSSPSSSPPQLAFGSPSQLEEPHQHLIRLAWSNRSDLETAVDLLERHNVDVWSARKRSNPSSDLLSSTFSPSEHWETVVRWTGDEEPLTSLLDRLSEAGVPHPDVDTQVSSLSSHLSSPLITSSYSRALSAATLVNFTSSSSPLAPSDDPMHATYHPYDGIYQILQDFERAYPEWVSVFSIGQSSEGREIWAVKVSNLSNVADEARTASSDNEDEEEEGDKDDLPEFAPAPLRINTKKRHKHRRDRPLNFVIAGGQHAREWIAPSTILYLIHDLVAVGEGEHQRKAEKVRAKLLNQVEFTFVPVVNVRFLSHALFFLFEVNSYYLFRAA